MENFDCKKFVKTTLIPGAKENLRKDGFIIPTCFIFIGNDVESIQLPPLNSDQIKEQVCYGLRKIIKQYCAWGYALIMETWLLQLQENELYRPPLKSPKRKDAIFGSARTYSSFYAESLIYIRRNNKFYYKLPIEMSKGLTGRFSNLLPELNR